MKTIKLTEGEATFVHYTLRMYAKQTLGMTADDVFAAYVKKNEVNFKRQESGYQEKDHDDSRHI